MGLRQRRYSMYVSSLRVSCPSAARTILTLARPAGASDATYHIMWIILYNALEDFGIREVNDVTRTGTSETLLPQHAQIEEKKRKVANEAQHGALRIAGLVSPKFICYFDSAR